MNVKIESTVKIESMGMVSISFSVGVPGEEDAFHECLFDSAEVAMHLAVIDEECAEDRLKKISRIKELIAHFGGPLPNRITTLQAESFYRVILSTLALEKKRLPDFPSLPDEPSSSETTS